MSIGYLLTSMWNGIGPTIQNGWEQAGVSWNGVQKTAGDINNAIQGVTKTTGQFFGIVSDGVNLIRKYWYVPVIIGGVIVGYRLVKNANPAQLSASAIRALAAARE